MELGPDAAFVCLHGPGGEDGTVQALLETLGIPVHRQRPALLHPLHGQGLRQARLRAAGLPTPPFRTFLRRAMNEMGAAAALEPPPMP